MTDETFTRELLQPKPFVFVLMPFEKSFDDIYKFGIKGAAADVGAYAERLDEQIFSDGILDRVFNQINRADVIVADMTGRNANVFYEVGYAHALGKIVLLLTQHADDIPFDLKHRQHLVYGGSIETLRRDLNARLTWAIREASSRRTPANRLSLQATLGGIELLSGPATGELPTIRIDFNREWVTLPLAIRNDSMKTTAVFSHVYLFTERGAGVAPFQYVQQRVYRSQPRFDGARMAGVEQISEVVDRETFITRYVAASTDTPDGLEEQYRLPNVVPQIPSGAVEHDKLRLGIRDNTPRDYSGAFRLRLHGEDGIYDFSFRMASAAPAHADAPTASE